MMTQEWQKACPACGGSLCRTSHSISLAVECRSCGSRYSLRQIINIGSRLSLVGQDLIAEGLGQDAALLGKQVTAAGPIASAAS